LGAVIEPGVRDVRVAEAWSDVAIADLQDVSRPTQESSRAPRMPGKRRRNRRSVVQNVARRIWIPMLIVVVIGVGGLTVARLHGIFGVENERSYPSTQTNVSTRFDPKHLTYEVFGPPGTVATISYFDVDANPKRVIGARLPWSVTFATSEATAVEDVVAQGDSDSLGCRILVDGVVKAERVMNEVSAFVSCNQKDG
jgi:hypothetical protein